MILLRDSSAIPPACKGGAVALGNFDGLHQGHLALIGQAIAHARQAGGPAGLVTFEPHPRRLFAPQARLPRLMPLGEKLRRLRALGLDFVRIIRFTREFASLEARAFVQSELAGRLGIAHAVTGEDFTFGRARGGNAALLAQLGQEFGFTATAVPPVLAGGQRCSSTRLREALAEGDMTLAAALLGRPYAIGGIVREGERRGRELGFPTANIAPSAHCLPREGVYAVQAMLDGKPVRGAAHLGRREMFGGRQMRLETHFIGWQGELYGQRLEVELLAFLRPDRAFSSAEALRAQMVQDCERAKKI